MPKRFLGFHSKCCSSVNYYGHCPLTSEDFAPFKSTSGYNDLGHFWGYSLNQLGAPFVLRRAHLIDHEYTAQYLNLIQSYPSYTTPR